MENRDPDKKHFTGRAPFFIRIVVFALLLLCSNSLLESAPVPKNSENMIWPGFEAFSFDRSQYYYNVGGHDYTQEEINTIVMDFYQAGFVGIMLELGWEYNEDYEGLGMGWYGPTNGDSILNRYFKDDKVTEYFISAAKSYGLKISIIISSLGDRIGTNPDGYTDPFDSIYMGWMYPMRKLSIYSKGKRTSLQPWMLMES